MRTKWNGIFRDEYYFDGIKAEEHNDYFADGGSTAKISAKGLMINDSIKIGKWDFFRKDGSKKNSGDFDKNKKTGEGQYWD